MRKVTGAEPERAVGVQHAQLRPVQGGILRRSGLRQQKPRGVCEHGADLARGPHGGGNGGDLDVDRVNPSTR